MGTIFTSGLIHICSGESLGLELNSMRNLNMSWIDWDGFEVLSWQEQEHLHVIIVLIFLSVYTKPQMFDLVSSLSETYLVNLKGNSLLTLITSSVSTQTVYSTCLKILSDSTALYILFYCFTVWTTHIHCVILLSPSMNLLTLPPAEISHLIFSPGDIRDASSSKKSYFPADWAGELDFSTLLSIMHRQLQQEAPEEEILEAMRMADKEQKGFILASELRAKLTGLGEKLTDREGETTTTFVL